MVIVEPPEPGKLALGVPDVTGASYEKAAFLVPTTAETVTDAEVLGAMPPGLVHISVEALVHEAVRQAAVANDAVAVRSLDAKLRPINESAELPVVAPLPGIVYDTTGLSKEKASDPPVPTMAETVTEGIGLKSDA